MSSIEGGYDFITKFSSFTAKDYAETVSKKNSDIADEKAKKLIKYIEKRYEDRIKNALRNDPRCHGINITLPHFKRVKNQDIQDKVEKMIENHFRALGFEATVHQGNHCSCVLDFVCHYGEFYIRLNW